ncbi:hypothetical protein P43SY_001841 [Pythium insidiosum]|uniref:EF-hand domain-containing protein n=1 Tax=Pythium insidiosum TaxID=114742 RepID=A0AAD5Q1J2_PYTIN|nr:hypothetical protein P43SY_001841 [Pythium insidiosum]
MPARSPTYGHALVFTGDAAHRRLSVSFYDEAKAQRAEIETLKATIYEQEQRRRQLEAQVLEREQCVAVLAQHISQLPGLRLQSEPIPPEPAVGPDSATARRERILKLVIERFDRNQDEKLDGDELLAFKRTTTRLREGFAEVRVALDGKDDEIRRIEQHRSHVDSELQAAKDQVFTLSTDLKKALGDLAAATTAVHDLRALVEDQVTEKEKWQRYCWELEERLFDAVHISESKERVLWKALDAKKEETRKNMLLYMESQRGKRHWVFPRDAKATNTEPTNQFLWGDAADDESDECSTAVSDCAIEQSQQ